MRRTRVSLLSLIATALMAIYDVLRTAGNDAPASAKPVGSRSA